LLSNVLPKFAGIYSISAALINVSNMYYIRFLKVPKLTPVGGPNGCFHFYTVIAITTDLGESFYFNDIKLFIFLNGPLSSNVHEREASQYRRLETVFWRRGMRSLAITAKLSYDCCWPARVVITPDRGLAVTEFLDKLMLSHTSKISMDPAVFSAWSAPLAPTKERHVVCQASKLCMRRIVSNHPIELNIWEETGESIARHIW